MKRLTDLFSQEEIDESPRLQELQSLEAERIAMLQAREANAVCKGSMLLGTGCGKCRRCEDEINEASLEKPSWDLGS